MNTTKEKPILFSSEMVRAILEGRKTQTRRVIKTKDYGRPNPCVDNKKYYIELSPSGLIYEPVGGEGYIPVPPEMISQFSPYKVGDRLWVRETFADTVKLGIHAPDDNEGWWVYKATDPDWDQHEGFKWTPSIFMPKDASRINLVITNVRLERLQDISEEDAIAEGIEKVLHGWKDYTRQNSPPWCTPRYSFCSLWNSINAKKYPWDSNPFVWVYEFKKY